MKLFSSIKVFTVCVVVSLLSSPAFAFDWVSSILTYDTLMKKAPTLKQKRELYESDGWVFLSETGGNRFYMKPLGCRGSRCIAFTLNKTASTYDNPAVLAYEFDCLGGKRRILNYNSASIRHWSPIRLRSDKKIKNLICH